MESKSHYKWVSDEVINPTDWELTAGCDDPSAYQVATTSDNFGTKGVVSRVQTVEWIVAWWEDLCYDAAGTLLHASNPLSSEIPISDLKTTDFEPSEVEPSISFPLW